MPGRFEIGMGGRFRPESATLKLDCNLLQRGSLRFLASSQAKAGGEGANRTHQRRVDRLSTVLKTAGTTRHPSLSLRLDVVNLVWNELDDKEVYATFLEVRI